MMDAAAPNTQIAGDPISSPKMSRILATGRSYRKTLSFFLSLMVAKLSPQNISNHYLTLVMLTKIKIQNPRTAVTIPIKDINSNWTMKT